MFNALLAALACALLALPGAAWGGPRAEVIHWWTSGGESLAVKQIAQAYRRAGGTWIDTAIAGGDQSRAVTLNRMVGGNPPTAAQFNTSKQFLDVVEEGMLNDVDQLAAAQDWDRLLPEPITSVIKIGGHYYAVPVNIHMQTWIWYSKAAFARAGIKREPATVAELFAALDKLKAAGLVPLAHGGQPWQDLTTFEIVGLGVGGADFYRQAFVTMDPAAWRGPVMTRIIDTFRRLKPYTDKEAPNRDWNKATEMVIKGQAGMQFMGDWAKGEFLAAGKKPESDFVCTAAPGTWNSYIYNIDSFAMFRLSDPQAVQGQKALASTIMSSQFQEIFNLNKGSIPAAVGSDMTRFDHCGQESSAYFVAASLSNTLVPSFAHKMAQSEARVSAVQAIVARLWDDDAYPAARAQADLVAAASGR
jgi:glucose/mannose transport system substrate-binding protein